MIQMQVHLKRLRPAHLVVSKFNGWVREALTAAGRWWVKERLPKHFEPGAVQRYQYLPRSAEYRRRKAGMARRMGYDAGTPLVYSRKLILSLAGRKDFNVIARATSSRQRVKVPLPLPHPMNAKHAPEIGRLNDPDLDAMKRVAIAELEERRRRFDTVEVLTIRG